MSLTQELFRITTQISRTDTSLGMQGTYDGAYFFIHTPTHLKIKISQDPGANVASTTLLYQNGLWQTIIYLPDPTLGHRPINHSLDKTIEPITVEVPESYLLSVLSQIKRVTNWTENFAVK